MTKRTPDGASETEWLTRKRRIDPLLDAAGWPLRASHARPAEAYRTEEEETANGPADYALWLDDQHRRHRRGQEAHASARRTC